MRYERSTLPSVGEMAGRVSARMEERREGDARILAIVQKQIMCALLFDLCRKVRG